MEYFEYKHLNVQRVIDGDTIDVMLDLGFSIYHKVRLRLYGINAPEMGTAEGREAKKFLESLIAMEPAVTLRTLKDKTDKFGRYLADLRGAHGSLNRLMIDGGHAKPYMETTGYQWE